MPKDNQTIRYDISLLSKDDIYLFNAGRHYRLYQHLGAHIINEGTPGTYFAVWAPNAEQVHVIGDFNEWNSRAHSLKSRDQSGIWEGFIPGVGIGTQYKYHISSRYNGHSVNKADPLGFYSEKPPLTASIVWNTDYKWSDGEWMSHRFGSNSLGLNAC